MKKKYLIIGNSAAGINAAEAIRKEDTEGTILLVSDESYHTYSRPLITYYLGNKISLTSSLILLLFAVAVLALEVRQAVKKRRESS